MEELNEEVVESKKGLTGRNEGKPTILIPGEIESVSKRGVTVAAGTVYDYKQNKFQQDINEKLIGGVQQVNDYLNDNVKGTLSEHSSEIENINEALEENIPYVIVYENQTVNIPCDPYGNYIGSEQEIGTVVKLYRGNIQQEIEYDDSIVIESPTDKGFDTEVIEDNDSAIISIPYADISNLDDTTEVDFHILSEGKAYYGKVIFNKVKRGKSAFEEWKDQNPTERANATPAMFISDLKNVDGVYGPKYAPNETAAIADADGATVIYFIPNDGDSTKYDIVLVEGEQANPLAQEISGDITNYAGIYDVSADHNNTPYDTLSLAIAAIPNTAKKGGMTIKFIQGTGDNAKYVQYRLTKSTFSTDVADWERVSLDDIRDSIKSILGGESDVDVEVVNDGSNIIVADNYATNLQKKTVGQTLTTASIPNYSITGYRGYKIKVLSGEKYKIKGLGNENEYTGMYSLTDSNGIVSQYNFLGTNSRNSPILIDITQNGWLYVNLKSFSAADGDGVFKLEKQQVTGLLAEKVSDAPNDGKEYVRKGKSWVEAGTEQVRNDLNGYDEDSLEPITVQNGKAINFYKYTSGSHTYNMASFDGYGACIIDVAEGDEYIINGKGDGSGNRGLYVLTNNNGTIVDYYFGNNTREEKTLTIPATADGGKLYVCFYGYDTTKDGVSKVITQHVKGIKERVSDIEESMSDDEDTPIEDFDKQINGYDEEVYSPKSPQLNKWVQCSNVQDDAIINRTGVVLTASTAANGDAAYFFDVKAGDEILIKGKSIQSNYQGFYVLLANYQDDKYLVVSHDYSAHSSGYEVTLNVEQDGKLAVNLKTYDSTTEGVFIKTTKHVNGIGDTTTALDNARKIEVCVPDVIHAVRGDTLQLFYHSIFRCVDYSHYDINVRCDIGAQFPKYYEVTPDSSTSLGNHDITFTIKDNNNNVLGTKKAKIKVVNTPVSPSEDVNILCVGASGTEQGQWVSEFKRRLVGTDTIDDIQGNGLQNITFVGRMDVTYNNKQVNLEATGGFDFSSYIAKTTQRTRFKFSGAAPTISVGDVYTNSGFDFTVAELNLSAGYFSCDMTGNASASGTLTRKTGSGSLTINYTEARRFGNPFYDDVSDDINLSEYIDEYCNGSVDVVFTELNGNGSHAYSTNFTARFERMQTFIDMFLEENPDCKICIGLQWNPCTKGGTGVDYKASGDWNYEYGLRYVFDSLCNALQKYINDNNLSDKVFIVNWLNEFDSVNNMQKAYPAKKVNTRNSATETFGYNGIHPAIQGYNQMADAAYRLFVGEFCQ